MDCMEDRVAMTHLSAAIVLTAQGIPLFQAGEAMRRTKPCERCAGKFDENSYRTSDQVNCIKWSHKKEAVDTVLYYQGLIQFRNKLK